MHFRAIVRKILVTGFEKRFARRPLPLTDFVAADANRILVVAQHYGVAELLAAKPALQALRNRFPDASIVLIANPATVCLFEAGKITDAVIEFVPTLKSWWSVIARISGKYDMSVVLTCDAVSFVSDLLAHFSRARYLVGAKDAIYEGCGRNLFYDLAADRDSLLQGHATDRNLAIVRVLGAEITDRVSSRPAPKEHEVAIQFLRKNGLRPDDFILMVDLDAPGDEPPWDARNYVATTNAIVKRYNAKVLVRSGTRHDEYRKFLGGLTFMPLEVSGLSLHEFIRVAVFIDVTIAANLDTMFVASAIDTPVVGLFGAIEPERYAPNDDRCITVRGYACKIAAITVADVIDAVERLVNRFPKSHLLGLLEMDISDQALHNYLDTLES
jgi:ADP-heptose:LPS heptosyltransferase